MTLQRFAVVILAAALGLMTYRSAANADSAPPPTDPNGLTMYQWQNVGDHACIWMLSRGPTPRDPVNLLAFRLDEANHWVVADTTACPVPSGYHEKDPKILGAICGKFKTTASMSAFCLLDGAVGSPQIVLGRAALRDVGRQVGRALDDPKGDFWDQVITRFKLALPSYEADGSVWTESVAAAAAVLALLGLCGLAWMVIKGNSKLRGAVADIAERIGKTGTVSGQQLQGEHVPVAMKNEDIESLAAAVCGKLAEEFGAAIGQTTENVREKLTGPMVSFVGTLNATAEAGQRAMQQQTAQLTAYGEAQTALRRDPLYNSLADDLALKLSPMFESMAVSLREQAAAHASSPQILKALSQQAEQIQRVAQNLDALASRLEARIDRVSAASPTRPVAVNPPRPVVSEPAVGSARPLDPAIRLFVEELASAQIRDVLSEADVHAPYDTSRAVPLAAQRALGTFNLDASKWEPVIRFLGAMNLEALDAGQLAALRPALENFLDRLLGASATLVLPLPGERINSTFQSDVTGSSTYGNNDIASVQTAGLAWQGRVILRANVKHRVS